MLLFLLENPTKEVIESEVLSWGCSQCGRPEKRYPNLPEEKRRKFRNCDNENRKALYIKFAPDGFKKRCPWSQIQNQDRQLFELQKRLQFMQIDYKKLPNKLVEAFQFIDQLFKIKEKGERNGR